MLDAHGRTRAYLMFVYLLVLAFFTIVLHGLTVRLTRCLAGMAAYDSSRWLINSGDI